MNKLSNPFDNAWFVEDKSTSEIITIDTSEYKFFTIKHKKDSKEIIIENNLCECGQNLDQLWQYCPKCGGKLIWKQ